MNYIKSLHIEGFKKFVSLDVQFNEHMNILVGENEAGKSTILDALKTVLNQQYRNADKSVLRDLFNAQMVAAFKAEPSVKTLPRIYIEVELALNPQQKNASYFYGEVYGQRKQQIEKFGIRFECKYDEELGAGMEQSIQEGKIPYEYYALNQANNLQHIFMGKTVADWTWEACIYKENKETLDKMIAVKAGATYTFHGKDYGAVLGKMLNHKVDVAYQMLTSGKTFTVPQYIKDAIEWLRK